MSLQVPDDLPLDPWQETQRQQFLHTLRHSTPTQRPQWVDQMLIAFNTELRAQKERQWQEMERRFSNK